MRGAWSRLAALCLGLALGGGLLGVAEAAGLGLTSQSLTPYRTCTITGTPTTSTAVADASVRQASAGSNFGTATTNNVASASAANRRLYLRFDLSVCSPAIPSSAIVRNATLRVYASGLGTSCRTLDIFRVTAAWTETAITWTNQPLGTSINTPPQASRTGSFDIGTPTGCANRSAGYVTGATVTSDVAAFVAGTSANYGWMVRDDVEGAATAVTQTFSAKQLGIVAQAPQLVVTYVTVP